MPRDDDQRIEDAEFDAMFPEPPDEEQLDRAEDRYQDQLGEGYYEDDED